MSAHEHKQGRTAHSSLPAPEPETATTPTDTADLPQDRTLPHPHG
ncbi:MAG: hypothetical protein M0026_09020 [Nocardiopsaceae bacterium]|nr:hypothetical protein [Nocardiopsaceae bacterium]